MSRYIPEKKKPNPHEKIEWRYNKVQRDLRYLRETLASIEGSLTQPIEDMETPELWEVRNRLQTLAGATVMLTDSVIRLTIYKEVECQKDL